MRQMSIQSNEIYTNPDESVVFYKSIKGAVWKVTIEKNMVMVWRVRLAEEDDPESGHISEAKKIFAKYNKNEAIEFCLMEALNEGGKK